MKLKTAGIARQYKNKLLSEISDNFDQRFICYFL